MGLAYKKNGLLYIAITNASYTNYHDYAAPDNNIGQAYFVKPTGTILTKDNLKDIWNNKELRLEKLKIQNKKERIIIFAEQIAVIIFPPEVTILIPLQMVVVIG